MRRRVDWARIARRSAAGTQRAAAQLRRLDLVARARWADRAASRLDEQARRWDYILDDEGER